MKEEIYVVYCYYPLFAKLPRRKWVKFADRKDARKFREEKVDGRKDRFFWAYVVNGMEVENI